MTLQCSQNLIALSRLVFDDFYFFTMENINIKMCYVIMDDVATRELIVCSYE